MIKRIDSPMQFTAAECLIVNKVNEMIKIVNNVYEKIDNLSTDCPKCEGEGVLRGEELKKGEQGYGYDEQDPLCPKCEGFGKVLKPQKPSVRGG